MNMSTTKPHLHIPNLWCAKWTSGYNAPAVARHEAAVDTDLVGGGSRCEGAATQGAACATHHILALLVHRHCLQILDLQHTMFQNYREFYTKSLL